MLRSLSRVRVLLLAALMAVVMGGTLSFSSASTLGGLATASLGGGTAPTKAITGVTLDWNLNVPSATLRYASTLRLTANAGESFAAGDTVSATVDAGSAGTCTGTTTVITESPRLDLTFTACELLLWDLDHVALSITGRTGATTVLQNNLGGITGTLSGFDGKVFDPDHNIFTGLESSLDNGQEVVEKVYADVHNATTDELTGLRALALFYGSGAVPTVLHTYTGTVGTKGDNDGIWAEVDPEGNGVDTFPTVIVDVRALAGGVDLPKVKSIRRYEVILLRPQHLTVTENSYAILAVAGTVEQGGGTPAVSTGTQPVNLDSRLTYSEPNGPLVTDANSLSFCYNFRVSNISAQAVVWEVVFDTTKPPLSGMNPTVNANSGGTGLRSIWNMQTKDYDPATGYWTIVGDQNTHTLAPGASVEGGYCATAPLPAADPSTYSTPQITVDTSNAYHVTFTVKVSSSSTWGVPWEAEVDFADYVCASSLPATMTGNRATLTKISGTRYLLRGSPGDTQLVSNTQPRDFIFTSYNPGGQPFLLGSCQ